MIDTRPVFYTLPAECLEPGMSTDDGQDILDDIVIENGHVYYHVYTPADDPKVDNERQCAPEARIAPVGQRVELAVFVDTNNDATTHEQAVIIRDTTQAD